MIFITIFIGIICAALGSIWREIYELHKKINTITKKITPKAVPGVTPGTYIPAKEYKESRGIVNPKTPQRIEWETQQQVIADNSSVDSIIERSIQPR